MQFEMFKYFLFLVLVGRSSLIYGFNDPRIRNGKITPPDLFQFVVKIDHSGTHCSGTIISKRHVLTAAQCFEYAETSLNMSETYKVFSENLDKVKVQRKDIIDNLNLTTPEKTYIPKTYFHSKKENWNSIAIIEFPEGTNFGIEPVKLTKKYFEKEGDEAFLAGFGDHYIINGQTLGGYSTLRHTDISMINDCYGTFKICGGNFTHRGLSGDAGGPMLIQRNNQWYEIGILSRTWPYEISTRISSFCNFIEEVTKNEVRCESGQMMPKKQFPLIYKGQETPLNIFDFVIPLYDYNYGIGCTATVISKRHLLTSAWCVFHSEEDGILTNHSTYKSVYNEFLPDFRSKNAKSTFKDPVKVIGYFPLNYKFPNEDNLAIIEFPEGTNFGIEPVTLAKDYNPVYLEKSIIVAGFGKYKLKKNMHIDGTPPTLQHTDAPFQTERYLDEKVYDENEKLNQDEGGPTLIERNGKFYQISVNFAKGSPEGFHTSVPGHCNFIEEVTKDEVKCESAAPILLPTNNNALKSEFQILLFLIVILKFFYF